MASINILYQKIFTSKTTQASNLAWCAKSITSQKSNQKWR